MVRACDSSAEGSALGETLMKTSVQCVAANWMAEALVKSPLNILAPAAASAWAAAEEGSRARTWTFWCAARRARATAPPWEPVAPVMRSVGVAVVGVRSKTQESGGWCS